MKKEPKLLLLLPKETSADYCREKTKREEVVEETIRKVVTRNVAARKASVTKTLSRQPSGREGQRETCLWSFP